MQPRIAPSGPLLAYDRAAIPMTSILSNLTTIAGAALVAEGAQYRLERGVKFDRFAWHTEATFADGAGLIVAAYQRPDGADIPGEYPKVFETQYLRSIPAAEEVIVQAVESNVLEAGVFHLVYAAVNALVTQPTGWDITNTRLVNSGLIPPGQVSPSYTWPGVQGDAAPDPTTGDILPAVLDTAALLPTSGNTALVCRLYVDAP